jgi:DNA-binding NarL/FixJ family response regulator
MSRPMIVLFPLSPRESEVLKLRDSGLLWKEVAARLHISLSTVMTHRNRIALKTLVDQRQVAFGRVAALRR